MSLRAALRCLFLMALATLLPHAAHAQSACPWLNAATASGVLGGAPEIAIEKLAPRRLLCTFQRRNRGTSSSLTIEVAEMNDVAAEFSAYKAQCHAPSPLAAIGNEAVMCIVTSHDHQTGQRIVARVRRKAIVVTLFATMHAEAYTTTDPLQDSVKMIADQVAGNLF